MLPSCSPVTSSRSCWTRRRSRRTASWTLCRMRQTRASSVSGRRATQTKPRTAVWYTTRTSLAHRCSRFRSSAIWRATYRTRPAPTRRYPRVRFCCFWCSCPTCLTTEKARRRMQRKRSGAKKTRPRTQRTRDKPKGTLYK